MQVFSVQQVLWQTVETAEERCRTGALLVSKTFMPMWSRFQTILALLGKIICSKASIVLVKLGPHERALRETCLRCSPACKGLHAPVKYLDRCILIQR